MYFVLTQYKNTVVSYFKIMPVEAIVSPIGFRIIYLHKHVYKVNSEFYIEFLFKIKVKVNLPILYIFYTTRMF